MAGGRKKPPAPGPLGEDDLDLWRRVTKDAKPLKDRQPPEQKAPVQAPDVSKPQAKATERRLPPRRPDQPAPAGPALTPGALADIDKRTAERLKRGKLPIDGRLDLHGHRQEEARGELAEFLADAQAAGKRCVLVITGKGPGREGGVLRQNLPQWLNHPANRARVVAFVPAQPKDGGHGAYYLLLKRRRR